MMEAIPNAVSMVRRGARAMFRKGIWRVIPPGILTRGERPRESAGAGGEVSGLDGVNRGDSDGAPDGNRGGGEWYEESERGDSDEEAGHEGRPPDGKRDEIGQHYPESLGDSDAHRYAERDAEQRDLGAEQERSDGYPSGRDAEGHGDADLAPLGVHYAAGEVERGEYRAAEYGDGKHKVELAVALHVFHHGADGRVVEAAGYRSAERGEAGL